MQEKICERLPDAQAWKNSRRHEAKMSDDPIVAGAWRGTPAVAVHESFQNKNGEIGDQEELHTRSDVKIEAYPVAFYSCARSHTQFSLRGDNQSCKEAPTDRIDARLRLC